MTKYQCKIYFLARQGVSTSIAPPWLRVRPILRCTDRRVYAVCTLYAVYDKDVDFVMIHTRWKQLLNASICYGVAVLSGCWCCLHVCQVEPTALVTFNDLLTLTEVILKPYDPGPDHGPSGPWGLKATAGPSYIYLQYWPYFSSILLLPSLLRNVVYVFKNNYFCTNCSKTTQLNALYVTVVYCI